MRLPSVGPSRIVSSALFAGATVLAALIAVGCGREPAPPAGATGAAAPAGSAPAEASAALPESAARLAAMLPDDGKVDAWTRARPARRFGATDLWEHIDGAAESVVAYGFEEMITAGYRRAPGGEEVTIDLYRMSNDIGAFGMFAQETEAGGETVAFGAEGTRRGSQLAFWHGPHYVKLTAFQEGATIAAGLEALARSISTAMGPAAPRPAVLARFPARDLQPRSHKVVPKDALGQSYLPLAYQAAYRAGASSWTLLLFPFESQEAASDAFGRYREFAKSGGAVTSTKAGAVELFTGSDSYYGTIVAGRSGTEMAIAVGIPTPAAGRSAVVSLLVHSR